MHLYNVVGVFLLYSERKAATLDSWQRLLALAGSVTQRLLAKVFWSLHRNIRAGSVPLQATVVTTVLRSTFSYYTLHITFCR